MAKYATPPVFIPPQNVAIFIVKVPNNETYRLAVREQLNELLREDMWEQMDATKKTPEATVNELATAMGKNEYFREIWGSYFSGDIDPPCFA